MAGVDNGGRSSSVAVAQGLKPSSRNAVGRQQGLGMTRQNPHSSSEAIARRARRGFSLIEAAIVLAVVGGVIGTIWVSAAAVYENHMVTKAVERIFTIARNIQNLMSLRDAETLGDNANISDALEDAGVIPDDWRSVRSGYISNSLSANGDKYNANGGQIISFRDKFWINLYGPISESKCMKLVTRASVIAANLNGNIINIITRDGFGGPARNATSFPVSLESTKNLCNGGSYDIYFSFSYTRNN